MSNPRFLGSRNPFVELISAKKQFTTAVSQKVRKYEILTHEYLLASVEHPNDILLQKVGSQ